MGSREEERTRRPRGGGVLPAPTGGRDLAQDGPVHFPGDPTVPAHGVPTEERTRDPASGDRGRPHRMVRGAGRDPGEGAMPRCSPVAPRTPSRAGVQVVWLTSNRRARVRVLTRRGPSRAPRVEARRISWTRGSGIPPPLGTRTLDRWIPRSRAVRNRRLQRAAVSRLTPSCRPISMSSRPAAARRTIRARRALTSRDGLPRDQRSRSARSSGLRSTGGATRTPEVRGNGLLAPSGSGTNDKFHTNCSSSQLLDNL